MIKANFNAYSTYVTDSLYQWDINQVLKVTGINVATAPEVHFSNSNMDRAVVRQATLSNGVITVNIPNSLLQDPLTINAHIGIYEGKTFKVLEFVQIPIIPKPRPYDYKFEDTDGEIYSYNALEKAMSDMSVELDSVKKTVSNVEFTKILLANNWVGTKAPYIYDIAHEDVTAQSTITITFPADITLEQVESFNSAIITGGVQNAGSFSLRALKEKPTKNIPVVVKIGGN